MFDQSADPKTKLWLSRAALATMVVLGFYLLTLTVGAFMNLRYIGSGVAPTNTITVQGEGEVYATPDVATFSFSVVQSAKTTAEAQAAATKKMNDALAYLKSQNINEKDIKTTGYAIYPKYDYGTIQCFAYPCPQGKQTLIGYEVSQSVEVKVHDTAKVGMLLAGVGKLNVENVSGVSFTLDNEDVAKDQARTKAIAQAKGRAQELAQELGVRLVRIVSFNENGGPVYFDKATAYGAGGAPSTAPEIPAGQNRYASNVTITYEIR